MYLFPDNQLQATICIHRNLRESGAACPLDSQTVHYAELHLHVAGLPIRNLYQAFIALPSF